MKSLILLLTATAFVISTTVSHATGSVISAPPAPVSHRKKSPKKRLRAFRSERELTSFLRKLAEAQKRERQRLLRQRMESASQFGAATETVEVSASVASRDESITNVQHAGVDEGGIVKLHGDHLIVLRRGRLFTIAIGNGGLTPVSATDAFGPDIDARNTWYDEMLVSGDTVVVIGYSYERGGTEIGLFRIEPDGNLRYRATYHLRSNDYYSSRNYASRLIGNKLIFYTPMHLSLEDGDPLRSLPALRRWHKGAKDNEFHRIIAATRVYQTERETSDPDGLALHTVTVCDLSRGEMACEATGVVGPPGHVFYVSPGSVYVWTSDWARGGDQEKKRSTVYRMPLDGSGPSALGVSGSPVDQFSFLESEDGYLNVLVRSEATGDGMWRAEVAEGDVALLRAPLNSFSNGGDAVPASSYRQLPKPEGYTFQNRFVGSYLLYGTGSGWGPPENESRSSLYAVRWPAGGEVRALSLEHGVDRIEAMGSDAVIIGTDGQDLHFSSVRLGGQPDIAHRYTRRGASQGELRSHGFFYKPESASSGLLGLPIRGPGRPGYEHLFDESASILFLRNQSLDFKELGEIAARPEGSDDECRASCVDWYGNARPLFVRGRVFALLGYEIVEGALTEDRIQEVRRISYAPQRVRTSGR